MKKFATDLHRPLRLDKETLKRLSSQELIAVLGGEKTVKGSETYPNTGCVTK